MATSVHRSVIRSSTIRHAGASIGLFHRVLRDGAAFFLIAIVHLGFVAVFLSKPFEVQKARPEPVIMVADIISYETQALTVVPTSSLDTDLPIEIDAPALAPDAIPTEQTESPRIDPDFQVSSAPFVSRAQLSAGEVATIILMLQIAADGSVISAEIVRSSGGEAASAAAIDYAKATRWIPGSIDGEPQAMQASLTVILGEKA